MLSSVTTLSFLRLANFSIFFFRFNELFLSGKFIGIKLGLENISQALGFIIVFRESSIVEPLVARLLFEATKRSNFSVKLTD